MDEVTLVGPLLKGFCLNTFFQEILTKTYGSIRQQQLEFVKNLQGHNFRAIMN